MSTPSVGDTANIGGVDYTVERFLLGTSTNYVICDPDGHKFPHKGALNTFVRPAQNPSTAKRKKILVKGVELTL